MLTLKGVYENGVVKLDESLDSDKRMRVIVTFLEEEGSKAKSLSPEDFSFAETRRITSKYNFSLSEAVVAERQEGI